MTVSELIDVVVSGINPEWTTLEKIRYVYLEVGKRVSKDTDFFFSVDGKLGEANLTLDEIKEVFYSESGRDLRIICRSGSYILKDIYSRIGIESSVIETYTSISTDPSVGEFDVVHCLLAIYDDDGMAIFATLTPDLPYIKMGDETRNFGSDIPYYRNYSGVERQIYKGNEIKHKVISREELKKIDLKLGYIDTMYPYNDMAQNNGVYNYQYNNASFYMVRDYMKNNSFYYEILEEDTIFYNSLRNFVGRFHNKIEFDFIDFDTITYEDWDVWVKNLCELVAIRINKELDFNYVNENCLTTVNWNYEDWLYNTCKLTQEFVFLQLNDKRSDFSEIEVQQPFNYNKWSRSIKKKLDVKSVEHQYGNLLDILDKMNALVTFAYNQNKDSKSKLRFNDLFRSLAFHFIEPNHVLENNLISIYDNENKEIGTYLSNYYIAKKFSVTFPKIFSCNDIKTDFNNMDYSEQVVIIKNMIEIMFPEINYGNSSYMKDYDNNYSAIQNRIHIYPVRHRETGEYAIVFNVVSSFDDELDYYFFYDLKMNRFGPFDLLTLSSQYINVSSRFKSRLEEVEYSEDLGFVL